METIRDVLELTFLKNSVKMKTMRVCVCSWNSIRNYNKQRLHKCELNSSRANCLCIVKSQQNTYIYHLIFFAVYNCFVSTMAAKFIIILVLALDLCEPSVSSDIEDAFRHHQVVPHAVNVVPLEGMKVKP